MRHDVPRAAIAPRARGVQGSARHRRSGDRLRATDHPWHRVDDVDGHATFGVPILIAIAASDLPDRSGIRGMTDHEAPGGSRLP